MESIEQRVKKIVAEQLGVNEAEIKNESSFLDDLGADSLDMVELVMALEDEFETEIQTKRPKRSRPCNKRLITSIRTVSSKLSLYPSGCPSSGASREPGRFQEFAVWSTRGKGIDAHPAIACSARAVHPESRLSFVCLRSHP